MPFRRCGKQCFKWRALVDRPLQPHAVSTYTYAPITEIFKYVMRTCGLGLGLGSRIRWLHISTACYRQKRDHVNTFSEGHRAARRRLRHSNREGNAKRRWRAIKADVLRRALSLNVQRWTTHVLMYVLWQSYMWYMCMFMLTMITSAKLHMGTSRWQTAVLTCGPKRLHSGQLMQGSRCAALGGCLYSSNKIWVSRYCDSSSTPRMRCICAIYNSPIMRDARMQWVHTSMPLSQSS